MPRRGGRFQDSFDVRVRKPGPELLCRWTRSEW